MSVIRKLVRENKLLMYYYNNYIYPAKREFALNLFPEIFRYIIFKKLSHTNAHTSFLFQPFIKLRRSVNSASFKSDRGLNLSISLPRNQFILKNWCKSLYFICHYPLTGKQNTPLYANNQIDKGWKGAEPFHNHKELFGREQSAKTK